MPGLISQRNNFDCGVCSLAMFLEVPYEVSLSLIGRDPSVVTPEGHLGVAGEEMCGILFVAGYTFYHFYPREAYEGCNWIKYLGPSVPGLRQAKDFINNELCRSLVRVPSKSRADCDHWVYIENGVVYDPSKMKYSNILEIKMIREMIVACK